MHLQRPVCIIDIEATGLDRANDRMVELSVVKVHNADTFETKTRRINPLIAIPAASTAIHGITDEMVKDCLPFNKIARGLLDILEGCDIGGFGCLSYDIPLLYNEFLRAGIRWDYAKHNIIDCGNIFKQKEPRDLTAALKFYCNEDLQDAHGAEADATATAKVFLAQLEKYADLGEMAQNELAIYSNYGKQLLDVSGKFSYNEAGQIIFNFGPKRGLPAAENLDFVEWMLTKDFPPDTVKICHSLFHGENDFEDHDNNW